MLRFVFFASALSLSGFAAVQNESENCPDGKQHYRANLRHIERGGIGYRDGYTTLEVFFASDPSQWEVTPFFDARGHIFDNGKWAANAGIGLRALWAGRVYGINTYYDYRNTDHFNANQIGAGLETLGELFDFRINGYLPVGAKMSRPFDPVFATFSGNYMLVSQKFQSAMKGVNAEFGYHFGKSDSFDFYAAAGPYYFLGKIDPATWGGKARISGTFKDILTLEISDSYDRTFHNKFQGQISLSFSFGPKSKVKEQGRTCKNANILNNRMLQPVDRQEIIVIDKKRKNAVAIDPATGLPYFFVFVDNTSSSNGTYESPYHSLAQAQDNSSPNDIIYVFPGNGTTTGMDSGIILKENQKFWGSGVSHLLQISDGTINIPPQTTSSPTITNTNIDTEGNAVTLAANNSVSGFRIVSAIHDAIYGTDQQNLEISSCTFENNQTFAIESSFNGNASISITNNQFLNNVNGIFLDLKGTSIVDCSNNTFEGQTSVSNFPLEISADRNILSAYIENNIFQNNVTGSFKLAVNNASDIDIKFVNNTITNNGTGSQSSLGSSITILPNGTTDHFSIFFKGNRFSENGSNSFYMHPNPGSVITNLEVAAISNTMSNNGGSGLVLATPSDTLMLLATDNTIAECNDNGIAVISPTLTSSGNIIIKNNTIAGIKNSSNGIAVNQDFSSLDLTILNNEINGCDGTGIISYANTGIDLLTMNISGNTISNCQNMSTNAASGLDIEQYKTLTGSIRNNTFIANIPTAVFVGSAQTTPAVCLTLTDNNNTANYVLDSGTGTFKLGPCDVNSVNTGMISPTGMITLIESCPDAIPCP
ncbi:MAG: inverse autotransporter beta domain-containing protein [Parachlamydiales bacterium]|nr:inverse autotransporter beta domain-containing protein [Parachlamydiales bacterium]